ncbi:MAG: hypothetical protein PWQ99_334 [Clostridia bacterium]|nr:hypothetical protein [Clostridia bacterium]MDN5365273.1 hypothetical protein [Thermacetogenium sp.]MDN5375777.1 hypothetical protein [Thermacetogenium sp.]
MKANGKRAHKFVRYADDCNIYVKEPKGRTSRHGKREEVCGGVGGRGLAAPSYPIYFIF